MIIKIFHTCISKKERMPIFIVSFHLDPTYVLKKFIVSGTPGHFERAEF